MPSSRSTGRRTTGRRRHPPSSPPGSPPAGGRSHIRYRARSSPPTNRPTSSPKARTSATAVAGNGLASGTPTTADLPPHPAPGPRSPRARGRQGRAAPRGEAREPMTVEERHRRDRLIDPQHPHGNVVGRPEHPATDPPPVARHLNERADASAALLGQVVSERPVQREDGAVDADGAGPAERASRTRGGAH